MHYGVLLLENKFSNTIPSLGMKVAQAAWLPRPIWTGGPATLDVHLGPYFDFSSGALVKHKQDFLRAHMLHVRQSRNHEG